MLLNRYSRVSAGIVVVGLTLSGTACKKNDPVRPEFKVDYGNPEPASMHESRADVHAGFLAYDLSARKVLQAHNPKQGFIPASCTKVLTTAAALHVLGSDYRFKTTLAFTGRLERQPGARQAVLHGDLYLKGGGDPSLSSTDLLNMLAKLEALGIRKVVGNLYVDESLFLSDVYIDKGMGVDAGYNPGLSALTIDYNNVSLRWEPKRERRRLMAGEQKPKKQKAVKKKPENYYFYFTPSVGNRSLRESPDKLEFVREFEYRYKKGKEVWLYDNRFMQHWWRGYKTLPVRQPALHAGYLLRKLARIQQNLELPSPEIGVLPAAHNVVAVHKSRPLVSIVREVLHWSNNLLADLLTMATAIRLSEDYRIEKKHDLKSAALLVGEYLQRKLPSIDWKGFVFANGSGLTSHNRISPEQIVGVLMWADSKLHGGYTYRSLLPISGMKGSLTNHIDMPETSYRVFAKTGTVFYGIGLAGFYYTLDNRKIAFAQFYDHQERRAAIDDSENPEGSYYRSTAYSWIRKHKHFFEERLYMWVQGKSYSE